MTKTFTKRIATVFCGLILAASVHAADITMLYSYMISTDYKQAVLGSYDPAGTATSVTDLPISPLGRDAALNTWKTRLNIIERYQKDDVIVLDAASETPSTPILNYSLGNGSNPYAIVHLSDTKAYVIRYGRPDILIVNPATGDTTLGRIDLGAYASNVAGDDDGLPEMVGGVIVNGVLYVPMQLQKNFAVTRVGLLAAINTASDAVTDTLSLTIKNPLDIQRNAAGTELYIGGGEYLSYGIPGAAAFGGVDRVNIAQWTATRVVEADSLHGNISEIEVAMDGNLWVLSNYATWGQGEVYRIDAATGAILDSIDVIETPTTMTLSSNNELAVADRGFVAPGIVLFDGATGAATTGVITGTFPPSALAFVTVGTSVGVSADRPESAGITGNQPNPFNPSTTISWTLARSGEASLVVYNIAGQVVRTLVSGQQTAGVHSVTWNGRDNRGRTMASGVYLARLVSGGKTFVHRMTLVK